MAETGEQRAGFSFKRCIKTGFKTGVAGAGIGYVGTGGNPGGAVTGFGLGFASGFVADAGTQLYQAWAREQQANYDHKIAPLRRTP